MNDKVNPVAIKKAIDAINAKYGEGTIFLAGKKDAQGKSLLRQVEFMPTGMPQVDRMLGGGIPVGKITMIYGAEGAGKSTFCLHMLSKYPIAAYVDAERAFSEERAITLGVDPKKTLIIKPETGEQALSSVIQLAQAGVPFIVVDSVAALVPRKEFELEEDTEKNAGISLTAGLLSRKIFAINNLCDKHNCTVMFVNQVRDKLNAMMFGEQTSLPGGHALKHASHVIIKIGRKETLKFSDEAVGMMCKISTGTKNRSASPFQDAEVPLIFDKGFVSIENYKEEMKEARKRSLEIRRQEIKEILDSDKK